MKIFIIAIILLSFLIGLYFYPQMPVKIASHWNAQGEVDGYMSRFWGLFLMPIIVLFLYLLFLFIPRIDPLKENIEKFRKQFDWLIGLIMLFLFYIYLLTIIWNAGREFNMTMAIVPAIGILFFFIGVLIEKAKRNWFVGIRTPWTLSSDKVWEDTHRLGGKLFKLSGIIALLGIVFPKYAIILLIVPAIGTSIYTIVYSYFQYKKLCLKK